jgi:glycosyltransferase involved in cell wall biosynthesis
METALLNLGAPESKIARFPWGIDCNLFTPTLKAQAMELRANLHIPATAPIILSNRNMKPLYNIDLIVRSFVYALQEFPSAILILLRGYGVEDYTQRIADEVDRLNLSANIRIVTQLLTPRQMAVFLNAAEVLLSIPNSDSFPISVLEGMACGAIPVLGNIEANRELIRLGGNATIVPTLDEKALASKIVYCLRHLSDLASWKDPNRSYVLQHYNWQDSIKRMEGVYQQVLNGKGGHVRLGTTRPIDVASE